jgi:fatty acid desaturase (delta-4 desaturase)
MLATARTWAGSALLGLLFALIGLNVQHDANHGAMFKDGRKNALWGLAQSWIGGSQLMWLQEHVVLHHMHTGDVEFDPDAQLAPVMRGHAGAPWLPWMRFQQFYFLLVELGYGVIPMFMSFFEVLCWRHKFERKFALSRLAWRWGLQSVALHLLFYARMIAAPVAAGLRAAAADPGAAAGAAVAAELAKVAVTVGVAGGYLAFFFFLSHNFDGVHFVAGAGGAGDQRYPERSGFLHQQASSSSNVAGEKLCVLNGGLNYQIEHHLFPRVAHSHYPHIAPVVRAFCERHGAPYVHFDSVGANLASVFAYLAKFSSPDYDAPVPKPEGPKAD